MRCRRTTADATVPSRRCGTTWKVIKKTKKRTMSSEAQQIIARANQREALGNLLETHGRDVAKTNPRLGQFALMLTHPEFAEFFDANFKSWADCQDSIMMLKMGAYLREHLERATGETVSGNQLASAMKQVIDDSETRRFMFERLARFLRGGTLEDLPAIQ